jgi:hypothetical protein
MKTLKNHIVEDANTSRGARKKRRRGREPAADDEPVRVIRSLGLDGATVSLPAAREAGRADECLLGSARPISVSGRSRRRSVRDRRAVAARLFVRYFAIYVRFTPESGHVQCNNACPLWARSRHLTLFDHLVRIGNARQPLVERIGPPAKHQALGGTNFITENYTL